MADKSYTTLAKVNQYLGKTLVTADVSDLILSAQLLIENLTGRNFKADSVASAKLFSGKGQSSLVIDDCIEVTKVEIGSNNWGDSFTEIDPFIQETNVTGYVKLPINYSEDSLPIRKLLLRSRVFSYGLANQRITAKWGWSETVPDDVSFAATVIVAGMYNYGIGGAIGGVKSERVGEYGVTFVESNGWSDFDKAKVILNNYVRHLL